MSEALLVDSIALAVASGTAVIIAATGELLVEKTGVYNIGLEGVMLIGALAGVIGADRAESWVAGLLVAGVMGALFALVFGIVTVVLRADMIVAGIALILIALGITGQVGSDYVRDTLPSTIPDWHVPLLSDIRFVGPALFQQPVVVYAAFTLPFMALFVLDHTRHGLNVRALGENPEAADAAGVSVLGGRLLYVGLGGVLGGIGGGVLTLAIVNTWTVNVTAGQGWIAFALVFFAAWRPLWILVGAYFFGVLSTLGHVGQAQGWAVPSEVYFALPYFGTVFVMVIRAWISQRRGEAAAWPTALGKPFFRQ
jgi:general nucleoside transport system permease protein